MSTYMMHHLENAQPSTRGKPKKPKTWDSTLPQLTNVKWDLYCFMQRILHKAVKLAKLHCVQGSSQTVVSQIHCHDMY